MHLPCAVRFFVSDFARLPARSIVVLSLSITRLNKALDLSHRGLFAVSLLLHHSTLSSSASFQHAMDVSAPSNEPSLGYFALSKNARAASLVPPPEGKPDTDLGLASEAQPRTLPDDGLPQNDKEAAMAASPSVAAFIDATGRERAIQSLTPQPDNAASNPDRAASAPVESTADSKAKPRDLVHTEEGHRYTDISKAQDAAPEAGSDPVLCDSPKEQERTAPLAQAESSTTNIMSVFVSLTVRRGLS